MAEKVKFGDQIISRNKRIPRGLILYPPKYEKSIAVRFVGSQQKIYQQWDQMSRSFSCSDIKKEGDILRIVSFVIDREDDIVKAFICPASAFNQLGEYDSGHDFRISRTGMGLGARYHIKDLGKTEVCQDLLDKVEITANVYSLSDIFIEKVKWKLLDKECEPITDRFEILDL